ncbi:hypothetical protein P3S67_012241 [Capsicum chacoense]
MTTPTLSDDNLISSLNSNEASSKVKEKPLLVNIKDTSTGEITTQKMKVDRVWNLEKIEKSWWNSMEMDKKVIMVQTCL